MPARPKNRITAQDLYRLQLISDVRISPDGDHAIFVVQRVDRKTEKKYSNLWIVPTRQGEPRQGEHRQGEPRQFTFGDQSDAQPRWSPDGSQIAFLSNRGDKEKPPQLYLIPFHGGEARPLASLQGAIGSFAWSPDGRRLVCTVRKLDEDELARQQDEQKKKLGVVARHYDRLYYKLDGFGYLPRQRWHIWTVDARSGKAQQLTDHAVFDEQYPVWSPDGQWIAFLSNRSPDPDARPALIDLFIIPSAGGEPRQVPTPVGEKHLPSFSPDGRWIAYYGQEGEGEWYRNSGLWVAALDGAVPPRVLTGRYDLHVSAWTIGDLGQPEWMPPTWSKDGTSLYFPVTLHGSSLLMSIGLDGENLQKLLGEGGVVGSFSFDAAQQRMAYFYGSMEDPGQVHLWDARGGKTRSLTHFNQDWLRTTELGEMETHWIKGPAGNDLQGWVLKPPGFDPAQKYPSILEIHGGPLTQYGHLFMHEFYYLAAQGFVVHFCNPRGGRGYGEAHAGAIWGAWGSADYDDLMAWTDFIAGQPYIDPPRMGVTGGSYGGYMTLWIIGHTRRFRAAVAQRSVSNFISMWGSSDFNWSFQQALEAGAPFEDLEKYWDRSPMKYIGSARTPTLVLHNENDLRCPIEQGEQVFVALKRLGVETEFVRFPDEFHGLSRTGRTDRRIARLGHIARWFKKYL